MSSQGTFNPFPGLRPFQIEEKFLFFGREEQTSELLTRLRKTRFLAVVGVSGSGKSSLVRAGLLPELHGGTMTSAGSSWKVAVMRPGGNPLTNLAEALIDAEINNKDEEHITSHVRATLGRSGKGLVEVIRQGELSKNTNLLLVVDQFEEIFRFRRMSGLSEEEAGHFITLLLEASEQTNCPIYVVLTMRSDFLGDCAQFRGLAEAVNEGEYLIPRLNRNQRRQAIEGPVAVGGLQISNRLTQRLLNDIGDDPDQLPILQHALMRTWDYWKSSGDKDPLDLKHYQATGGMAEALSQHADEVFAELPDNEHRWICEKIFKALTERVDESRGVRRPMQMLELYRIIGKEEHKIRSVVDSFRTKGRTFIMPNENSEISPATVIDIAHESLMRVWQTLRNWVDDEAQSAKIYRRLADTSNLYKGGKAGLYRNPDLQIALSWREEARPNETWAKHYFPGFKEAMAFLDKSQEESERNEIEREELRQRELAQAQALAKAQEDRAEAEKLRAEDQAHSASRLRKMLTGLAVTTCAALIFLFIAIIAKQATEEAKEEVEIKIIDLAKRSIARGDELSIEGESLRALPWYADAAFLSKGDPNLQQAYKKNLEEKIQQTSRLTEMIFRDQIIGHAEFMPNGKSFFITEGVGWTMQSKIDFYDISTRKIKNSSVLSGPVKSINFSKDGLFLYTASGEREVTVWDTTDGTALHRFDKHEGWVGTTVSSLACSLLSATSDNRLLAVPVGGAKNGVIIWNLNNGDQEYPILGTKEYCVSVAFSNDNNFLVGATGGNWDGVGSKGAIYIWRLSQNDKPILNHIIPIDKPVNHVQFHPEKNVFAIACGSMDGDGSSFYSQVIDAASGDFISKRMEHNNAVFRVSYSPNGRWILTASTDGSARTWNATTGTPISPAMIHNGSLNHATFSPDGALVATAGSDNIARVWNATTGEPVTAPLRHLGEVTHVSFDPNCRSIITASEDQIVRIYKLPLDKNKIIGTASQSSTAYGRVASRAVDGNNDANFYNGSVSQTSSDATNGWWQFDFSKTTRVSSIVLWNHLQPMNDNWNNRLVNFRLILLDSNNNKVWEENYLNKSNDRAPNPKLQIQLPTEPLADKLRIEKIGQTDGANTLSIAEVEVFASLGLQSKNNSLLELQEFSQLSASSKISPTGTLKPLTTEIMQAKWASLKTSDLILPLEADLAKWHKMRATKLYENKHWSGFFFHHSRMEQKDKNSSEFIIMQADAYAELGQFQKALDFYLEASKFSPNNIDVITGCLILCAQQGRFSEAQKLLKNAISSFKDNHNALSELSHLLLFYPNMIKDIKVPLDWILNQYNQRPGYIDLGDSKQLRIEGSITIEGWFKSTSNWGLVNKGGAFVNDGYCFTLGNNIFRFELQNTRTQEKSMADVSLNRNGEWVHLAASWDEKTKEMILYVGGIRQSQIGFFNGPIGVSQQKLNLGRSERALVNFYCDAGFSEFRIWNVVRTEDEIKKNMNIRLNGSEPGIVGYWPFDQNSGTVARTGITSGINGVIVNPIWKTTTKLPFTENSHYCEVSMGQFDLTQLLTQKGGLQYRNGNLNEAAKHLEYARNGGSLLPRHMVNIEDGFDIQWLLLAQCYKKLGENEKAANLLLLANDRINESYIKGKKWQDRLLLKSLLEETQKIFNE